MKKITLCILLMLSCLLINAQNIQKYVDSTYNGTSIVATTYYINFDLLVSQNKLSTNMATYTSLYNKQPMIVNTNNNTRGLVQVYANKWGQAKVDSLLDGKYQDKDTNQVALFNLVFSSYYYNHKAIYECELRLRRLLDGNIDVDSICIGINLIGNIIVGNYKGEISEGFILKKKNGGYDVVIKETTTLANEEEINKRY